MEEEDSSNETKCSNCLREPSCHFKNLQHVQKKEGNHGSEIEKKYNISKSEKKNSGILHES